MRDWVFQLKKSRLQSAQIKRTPQVTKQFIGAEFIPLFSRRNKKNTAGDKTIQRGGIHSALLLNQFNKAFPLFKGKTELVPMNIGIDNDLGYAKRATKRVWRLP
jgi:hypothetical protein